MKKRFLILPLLLFFTSCEREPKRMTLFDGETLDGWVATSDANWTVEGETITVDSGAEGFLLHEVGLENFELELKFKAGERTNSGVFVRFDGEPTDPAVDCYEINIAPPDNPFPTGSIVARERVTPDVPPGKWHAYRIEVVDGTVRIRLNGEWIVEHVADPVSSGGWIGLQYREGPVAFRKIRIREI